MTPAEKRVKELIDRWLTSLDLHMQYAELNDSAYNKVQPWPVHDRPTRWVLELAKQKSLELQAAFESRLAMGDAKFAESIELVVFLANLVGLQHVQRFIPLADPERHGQATLTELDGIKPVKASVVATVKESGGTTIEATVAMAPRAPAPPAPQAPQAIKTPPAQPQAPAAKPAMRSIADDDSTREMPRPQRPAPAPMQQPAPVKAAPPKSVPPPPPAKKPAAAQTANTASGKGAALTEIQKLVVDDAVRLLNWGRPWHELAELVARIADRPKVAEVRRILRANRATIETRAAASVEEKEK